MIAYSPLDGDVLTKPIQYRAKTCFVMTQLGKPIPDELEEIRKSVTDILASREFSEIDASSKITGKDFLLKIWQIALSVPVGIGIIIDTFSPQTYANIYYEIGLMHALGKETLVVKSPTSKVPSDFVRTEYIQYDDDFSINLNKYIDNTLDVAAYYSTLAEQVKQNPLLSIDYYKRSYLITGNQKFRKAARTIYSSGYLDNVLESLNVTALIDFSWLEK